MAEVSFGGWLKRRRGAVGLTQKELAQKINCSVSAVRKMEAEERRPSAEVVDQLMQILEIPAEEGKAFLRFARGDWQAFGKRENEDTPWHVSRSTKDTNLPVQLTIFIGREKDQDKIIDLISKNRLVTLAGVGGIGKTRLALQVGQRLLDNFPHGIWFIALDSLSDPALIPQTVASIFDIRDSSDRSVSEILINVLRQKNTLLILDNCEHLLDACAQLIKTLLQNCPNLKILVTSREVLQVKGEAIYLTPALSMPTYDEALFESADYEAVQLFTKRAALAQTGFALTKENAHIIADICLKVDGLPLAIELAAAHVNILSVEEILKQLQDSIVLLGNDGRSALTRHQTLQASMDWSWGLLTESEQIFLRQLAVFAGGWTLESAGAVCDKDAFKLTSALAKKSLIKVDQVSGRETRYSFHEIVRQYAHDKLIETGGEKGARTRHLKYFLQFCQQAESALRGHAQMEWYARLNFERDNIHTALEWADQTNVEAGLYMSGWLYRYWEQYDARQGAYWLERFIRKPESKHYPLARAKALCVRARLMYSVRDFNFAYLDARESLDLYKASGDQLGEIDALLAVVSTEIEASPEENRKLIKEALALSKSLRDPWREAYALAHLGWLDNYESSVITLEKAVALFEKVGDLETAMGLMLEIVTRHTLNGNHKLAQNRLDELKKRSQNLNITLKLDILHHDARIAVLNGDYEGARTGFLECRTMAQVLGQTMLFLWTRVRLGYVELLEGNLVEAGNIFTEVAVNFLEDQNAIGVVYTLEGMASLYNILGKADRATCLIGWADATRAKIYDTRPPIEQVDVDKIIAACLSQMGKVAFADAYEEGKKMSLEEAVKFATGEN